MKTEDRKGRPEGGKLDLDVDEIVRRYKAGATMAALAEAFEVSQPTIRARLQECGVRSRTAGATKKVRKTDVRPLYYRDRLPQRTIARILEIDETTLRTRLKEWGWTRPGISRRPKGAATDRDAASWRQTAALDRAGKTQKEIAAILGVSRQTVNRRLRKLREEAEG